MTCLRLVSGNSAPSPCSGIYYEYNKLVLGNRTNSAHYVHWHVLGKSTSLQQVRVMEFATDMADFWRHVAGADQYHIKLTDRNFYVFGDKWFDKSEQFVESIRMKYVNFILLHSRSLCSSVL